MKKSLRIVLLFVIIPPLIVFLSSVFMVPFILIPGIEDYSFVYPLVVILAVIATVPIGISFLRAKVDDTPSGFRSAVRVGAYTTGGVGFVGGIVVAEIFWPEGDMNFMMGPVVGSFGFVLGVLGGVFYWLLLRIVKKKK